ncbi:hypothetical protein QMZ05_01930 [Bradyrhizobium sp. INPA03-11B]|uniref:hypothetical protein n=1 Tax=Bradyrhizobium sp. INPA03-11B TaxID=418598 RepID=UPI00338DA63E
MSDEALDQQGQGLGDRLAAERWHHAVLKLMLASVSTNLGIGFATRSISPAYLSRIEPLVWLFVPSTSKLDHSRAVGGRHKAAI